MKQVLQIYTIYTAKEKQLSVVEEYMGKCDNVKTRTFPNKMLELLVEQSSSDLHVTTVSLVLHTNMSKLSNRVV